MCSSLCALPLEIIDNVLSHLPPPSLKRLRCVSRDLEILVNAYLHHQILCYNHSNSLSELAFGLYDPALMSAWDDLGLSFKGFIPPPRTGCLASCCRDSSPSFSRFSVTTAAPKRSCEKCPTAGALRVSLDNLDLLYQLCFHLGRRTRDMHVHDQKLGVIRLWKSWLNEHADAIDASDLMPDRTVIWSGVVPDVVGFLVSIKRCPCMLQSESKLQPLFPTDASDYYDVAVEEIYVGTPLLFSLLDDHLSDS